MKFLKRRNFIQINENQESFINNMIIKKMKFQKSNDNYINPIINENQIYIKINKTPSNNNNKKKDLNNINNKYYEKINHIIISNALKSEMTFSNIFKNLIPKKIEFLEDKTRMQIDLE